MRDKLTFAARLGDQRTSCVPARGSTTSGDEVCFVVEPALFHANLQRQAHWAGGVEMVAEHYRAGLAAGMTPAAAWTITAPFLPDDLAMGVSLRALGEAVRLNRARRRPRRSAVAGR